MDKFHDISTQLQRSLLSMYLEITVCSKAQTSMVLIDQSKLNIFPHLSNLFYLISFKIGPYGEALKKV